ncbi:hypothetical protein B0H14DRAFT_3428870 [Mycena olivaceomarginata]|nr:hypothetical protein B0H14DRAFT_3428870 [Mycena olivaceomarginata]
MWGRPTSGCAGGMWNTGTIVLTQLEQHCISGEPVIDTCVCGARHREYLAFSTIGTFMDFNALMTQAIISMGEQPNPIFYDPPSPHDIYNLIHLFLSTMLTITLHILPALLPNHS